MNLPHINRQGNARMVDVGDKEATSRQAKAEALIKMLPKTLTMIQQNNTKKGDVLAVATVAGINAAKQTSTIIPMCHNVLLSGVDITFEYVSDNLLHIIASVLCEGKTGVEMEALTAVSVAALTVYDMCKAVDRAMEIKTIRLVQKSGGKSGEYQRSEK